MRRAARTLAAASLAVAALDMAVALGYWSVYKDVPPSRILQGIASGWVGREAAVAGGMPMAWLGAASHVAIATAMVVVYWSTSRRMPVLVARPVACGLAYGLATWAAMKFVVLPLSAASPGSADLVWQALHLGSHLFIVGLISAWAARALDRGQYAG